MKKFRISKTHLLTFLVIMLAALNSCKDDGIAPPINSQEDYCLIGAWKSISGEPLGSPRYYITGIEITPSGLIRQLAVETSTGKFAVDDDQYPDTIWVQNSNYIRTRLCAYGDFCTDSGTYSIKNDILTLTSTNFLVGVNKYIKTALGSVVAAPVQSDLSLMIDSLYTGNDKINPYPSAYAIYEPGAGPSKLVIHASLENDADLSIHIEQFLFPQTYQLGGQSSNRGFLEYYSNSIVISYETDSIHTGTISIDTLNLDSMTCSGTFQFDAAFILTTTTDVRTIRNGIFSIPIYPIITQK